MRVSHACELVASKRDCRVDLVGRALKRAEESVSKMTRNPARREITSQPRVSGSFHAPLNSRLHDVQEEARSGVAQAKFTETILLLLLRSFCSPMSDAILIVFTPTPVHVISREDRENILIKRKTSFVSTGRVQLLRLDGNNLQHVFTFASLVR